MSKVQVWKKKWQSFSFKLGYS